MPKGGYRPTAPQNNPANVSALGGNGQSGRANQGTQAPKYIPGMAYGQGQATMAQQAGAPMAGPTPAPQAPQMSALRPVTPITEPTQRPNESIMSGAAKGPGPGPESLVMPQATVPDDSAHDTQIDAYAPVLQYIAGLPTTSQDTRDVLSLLLRGRANQ